MKTSPAARSKRTLQDAGYFVAVTERWNPYAKIRQDMGGFADLVAWGPGPILAVQATSSANVSHRKAKILSLPQALTWLQAGGRLQIHGWGKQGARGKRKVWTLRVEELRLEDFQQPCP